MTKGFYLGLAAVLAASGCMSFSSTTTRTVPAPEPQPAPVVERTVYPDGTYVDRPVTR